MSTKAGTPDLTFVVLIHQALRIDAVRLIDTVAMLTPDDRTARLEGVREFYDRYRAQLIAHHTHEDTLYFPALAALVGKERMHMDELVAQHHELDDVLQAAGDGLAALADPDADFDANHTGTKKALASIVEHLTMHLDLEERTALPLVESEMSADEYKQIEARARKAAERGQAAFLIPWIVEHATPEQQKALFRSAPPLRVISMLTRRRYRRLDQALVPAR